MKHKHLMMLLPLIFLTITAYGCAENKASANQDQVLDKPVVGIYTVGSEEVKLLTEVPGRTSAYRIAEVRPQVNGIILKKCFEEGSLVEAGQVLYEIDSSVYQASYDKAVAHMENTERIAQRQKSLREKQSLSIQDYENSLYAWRQAQAEAELARINLEYCRITAPISGRIGRSNVTEGALAANGQTEALAVIQQYDPIYVDLTAAVNDFLRSDQLTGEDAPAFYGQSDLTLILADGSRYPLSGQIKFLNPSVDQGTGTVSLRAELPNPDGKLLPGMFVRAEVVEKVIKNGQLIPQEALVRDQAGQAVVWVLKSDHTVEKRQVQADRTVGNTWLVKAGLADGEKIVAEGTQFLSPGLAVEPKEAGSLNVKLAFNAPTGAMRRRTGDDAPSVEAGQVVEKYPHIQ